MELAPPRPVPYRWVVLAVFSVITCLNCVQWIMFAPIAGTVKGVVGCSGLQVDSLSLIFMATYTLLAMPALRITDLFGLRGAVVAGAATQAAGAWLRCWPSSSGGGTDTTSYAALMVGQLVISLGQLPLLGAPPKLSLVWFGAGEWALATAVAVLANQSGGAVAYVASPRAVPSGEEDRGEWAAAGRELRVYLVGQALACSAAALLAFLLVPSRPPHHPSRAAALADEAASASKAPPPPSPGAPVVGVASGSDANSGLHRSAGNSSGSWADFSRGMHRDISKFLGYGAMATSATTTRGGGYLGLLAGEADAEATQSHAATAVTTAPADTMGAANPMVETVDEGTSLPPRSAPRAPHSGAGAGSDASGSAGLLLVAAYGLAVGCSYAVSTLLPQLVAPLALGKDAVGWAGCTVTLVGLAGSAAAGVFLDRRRAFQWRALRLLLVASAAAMLLLALVVASCAPPSSSSSSSNGASLLFLAAAALGFFLTAVLPVGFELAAELSFPASPDAAAAVLNVSAQVCGIALILACDGLLVAGSPPTAATAALAAALAVAAACAAAIRGVNRRQDAQHQGEAGGGGSSVRERPS